GSWHSGRVAARGASAADGEATNCRVLGRQHTFGGKRAGGRIRAAAPRPRLDRGPHDRDRISLGRRAQRSLGRDRGRVYPAQSRHHRHGPGGNVTGLSALTADLAGKRLDLLRALVPGLGHLAIMGNVGNPVTALELGELLAAARPLGLQLDTLEIRRPQDIASALDAVKGRADALYVCQDLLTRANRLRINTLTLAARLPVMHA